MYYLAINNKKMKIKDNKFSSKKKAELEVLYLQPDYEDRIDVKKKK